MLDINKKLIKKVICTLLLISILILSIISITASYLLAKGPLEEDVIIVINKGTSAYKVAKILEKKQIIYNPYIFWLISKLLIHNKICYGEYKITKNSNLANILEILSYNKVIVRNITFPEGVTNYEVMRILNENNILIGKITKEYQEGTLLPNTYQYIYGDSKQKILNIMKNNMDQTIDLLWQKRKSESILKNKKQVLILASIIEKESGLENEKRRIAAVYINRLKKNMLLQADPTVIYSITQGALLGRLLTKNDLRNPSVYNTYLNKGLPPEPICNPSKTSIEAALDPLETNEIFMVATGTGGHNFSINLKDHNKHVASYRKILKG